jgi:hypothetical protein
MTEGNWNGSVVWFNPRLNLAVIEYTEGFVIGSVESGSLQMHQTIRGAFARAGLVDLSVEGGEDVSFMVEAHTLSEDQINDLLGFVVG